MPIDEEIPLVENYLDFPLDDGKKMREIERRKFHPRVFAPLNLKFIGITFAIVRRSGAGRV